MWAAGGNYDPDSIRKVTRQPELDFAFLIGLELDKVMKAFYKDNNLSVVNNALLDSLLAHFEPIAEAPSEFLLDELDLLLNVEDVLKLNSPYPELDEDLVDHVEVVRVVSTCTREMRNDDVVENLVEIGLLPAFHPVYDKSLG